jgi:hypothetical protein
VATKAITYALGKDCILRVEGRELHGVADVVVRESCTTVDATNYGQDAAATAVVIRSYDLGFTVGGLLQVEKYFTIHEVDADEPIDGAVIPRFQLREWDALVEEA